MRNNNGALMSGGIMRTNYSIHSRLNVFCVFCSVNELEDRKIVLCFFNGMLTYDERRRQCLLRKQQLDYTTN